MPTSREFNTMSDAFSCVSELCTAGGYEYFLIYSPPEIGEVAEMRDIILTNLPLYVAEDLIAMNWLQKWSAAQFFQKTSAPFFWSSVTGAAKLVDANDEATNVNSDAVSECDKFISDETGARFAYCMPAATRGSKRSFLTLFSTGKKPLDFDPSLLLNFQFINDQLQSLSEKRASLSTRHDLNKREIECLRWASEGKTSGEIAVIVSLSEHTVNHYLNSCCKKLDCVNRTQAVARSIRIGILN